jgi:hypothetical protein
MYYCGDHPLPWLPSQAQAEFRRILRMTRSNYMGLVVDATAERLSVEGFRLAGEDGADEDTWRCGRPTTSTATPTRASSRR